MISNKINRKRAQKLYQMWKLSRRIYLFLPNKLFMVQFYAERYLCLKNVLNQLRHVQCKSSFQIHYLANQN